jgi:alpha-tubulin suppressor-like RCC1 family protein
MAGIVTVPGVDDAVEISVGGDAGTSFTLARLRDGRVLGWGTSSFGQIGLGVTTDRVTTAMPYAMGRGAIQVAAGDAFACARKWDGSVWCWGGNASGQLGVGTTVTARTPVRVPSLSNVAFIEAGATHACAILADQTLACWGANSSGQLGDGSTTGRLVPTAVPGLTLVNGVDGGGAHTCAVLTSGAVRCWGSGTDGRLGNGATTASSSPIAVTGIADAQRVSASRAHTCAVLAGGGVRCWGDNTDGQLGDGTTTDRTTSVAVAALAAQTGVDVVTGGGHTCATLAPGIDTWCWGRNASGQVGNGSAGADVLVPYETIGLASGRITVGDTHSCVATSNTLEAQCWGLNFAGQVGDGTQTNRSTETDVVTLTDVHELTAGDSFTCARRGSGDVRCWGDNDAGELGDGVTDHPCDSSAIAGDQDCSMTPVMVALP